MYFLPLKEVKKELEEGEVMFGSNFMTCLHIYNEFKGIVSTTF